MLVRVHQDFHGVFEKACRGRDRLFIRCRSWLQVTKWERVKRRASRLDSCRACCPESVRADFWASFKGSEIGGFLRAPKRDL